MQFQDEEEEAQQQLKGSPQVFNKKHPPGLTGNLEVDKRLVDKKLEDICMTVDMTPREIVSFQLGTSSMNSKLTG